MQDHVKGAETAAAMIRLLRSENYNYDVHLTVRGSPAKTVLEQERRLSQSGGTLVRVKPFTANEQELAIDMIEADLVIAPAFQEDWGLAAWEAIARQVPTFLNVVSGVGRFLNNPINVPSHFGEALTVPEPLDERDRALLWAQKVIGFMNDPGFYEKLSQELGDLLTHIYTWDKAATNLNSAFRKIHESRRSGPAREHVLPKHFRKTQPTGVRPYGLPEKTSLPRRERPK